MENEKFFLDRNENNYGPAPLCLEVVRNADSSKYSKYTKAYKRGVKSPLSERLAKDFNISEKRVLLGYGAEDLLKQVVQCHLGQNKKLMIPSHSWWYYKEIANEVDGINIEYPLIPGEDTFNYDIDKMLEIYETEKPEIVFLSSPNNPTGNSITQDDLITVLDKLTDAIVVLDEAYWYSNNNEQALRLINKYQNLVIIRTFSKYYALAGIRIGYALIGEKLEHLAKISNRYLGYNRLSEEIAIAALDSQDYYSDIADKMNADKEMYYNELGALENFKVYKSNANFVLVELPKDIMKPLNEFLTDKGIIIKFMNEPVLNSHLRITLGTQEQNKLATDAIKEFVG